MNRDQADLAAVPGIAECFHNPRLWNGGAASAGKIKANEIAVFGRALVALLQGEFAQRRAVDRLDHAAAARVGAIDTE